MAGSNQGKLDPIFNIGSGKVSSNLTKPFLDPIVTRLHPTIPYDGSRSQNLLFTHTVNSANFFKFSMPSLFLEYNMEKEVDDGAGNKSYQPVAATDRVLLDAPFSIIRSIKLTLNSVSVSLNLPNDNSLSRLIALAMRTSSAEFAEDVEHFKELMFLPNIAEDVKAAAGKSALLENFLNMSTQQGQGSLIVPILLPFWPFGSMPLLSKLRNADPAMESSRVFPEHSQLSINIGVRAASELSKYVRQLKATNAATTLKLKVNIKDIFLQGQTYTFPQNSTFMKEYRSFCRKNRAKFPITLPTDIETELVSKQKDTYFRVNTGSFKSRFLLIYFKTKTQDEGATAKHINVTDFAFPTGLLKIHIYAQEDSLACTPVEHVATYFPDKTKHPFFLRSVKYLRNKPTMRQYFTEQYQQFVVIDLYNLNQKYGKLNTSTPDVTVRMTWSEAGSPDSTYICAFSFSEHMIEADMASTSGGDVSLI